MSIPTKSIIDPELNYGEFTIIKSQAGLNSYGNMALPQSDRLKRLISGAPPGQSKGEGRILSHTQCGTTEGGRLSANCGPARPGH
jgi:hypothetical protein